MWQMPSHLPDLRQHNIIAIDLETNDEGLRADLGSSWPWRGGYICGIGVAWHGENGIHGEYVPLRHPNSENVPIEVATRWLADLIVSDVRIVTQNGLYDWGWIRADLGLSMPESDRLEEIGALATMIDEDRYDYRLDSLAAWRGLPGKDVSVLTEAIKSAGWMGRKRTVNIAEHIYKLPAHLVAPYAISDAIATLALYENLNPVLDCENTRGAYRLEVDLLRMVLEMRRRGIRVDLDAAERGRDHCFRGRDAAFAELSEKLGTLVGMEEIGRNKWLAETFDAHGITYPRTEKGSPSFTKDWMPQHEHWLPQLIIKADNYNDAGAKFLQTFIIDHTVNGRIHAEIHPHRSDFGGTRSLRFSYSHPPLQQMTAHNQELAPLIRGVFLPEEGQFWAKPDISQQEFRMIVHYAAKSGLQRADEAVARYRDDPNTDYHNLVSEWCEVERQLAKNTNFAKAFGAGVRKFAAMIGKTESEAREIYDRYDRELPFVKQLSQRCQSAAERYGYLVLYDGARRHWDKWEAPEIAWARGTGPCSWEEAERRIRDPNHSWYRRFIRRASAYKAMNALIQGSAARHTKLWMRACWRQGIVPMLQMHDCLDISTSDPAIAMRVAELASEVVALEVPVRVDLKFGRSWGDAKHSWEELTGLPAASMPAGVAQIVLTPELEIRLPESISEPEPQPESGRDEAQGLSEPATLEGATLSSGDETPESRHLCAHCRVDPPSGSERPSAYEGLWLHPECEEAFIRARMLAEGVAYGAQVRAPGPGAQSAPELRLNIEITRLTKSDGPLTKRISLAPDGTVVSDGSACTMGRGTAERVVIAGIDDLAGLIGSLNPSQAIALGALRADLPDQVQVVSKKKLEQMNGVAQAGIIARTGANIVFRGPAFGLFDFDAKGMPPVVAAEIKRLGGFWRALKSVLPVLSTTAFVARRSTTTGLSRVDTGEALPGSKGMHIYITAKDGPDIDRFLKALHDRCWLAGLGWMMVGAAGALLERSIIDRMVGAPEHLVFEGGPILVPPIAQNQDSRRPVAVAGGMLDTVLSCPPLSIVERSRLEEHRARERERLAIEAARVREAFVSLQVKRLVERTGKTEQAARKVIERQCEGVLHPDVELPFDDAELAGCTVADVLADPERFAGETLADPLEGIEYGKCKAKVMRRADGTPWIHSFAHGRTIYALNLDSDAVRKALEEAVKPDVVLTFAKLVNEADLDPVEHSELRRLTKKLSGIGLAEIDDVLKAERRKKTEKERVTLTAQRQDPRPQIQEPNHDFPWLPQMDVLNEIIGGIGSTEPPARDIDGDGMQVSQIPVPNTHAFVDANQKGDGE